MSKTRDTGFLANVIQVHDTGVRIMSGSTMLMAISSSGQVTITGELSGSDAANSLLLNGTGSLAFTTTASFLVVSASQQQISSSLLQVSASYTALSGSYNTYSSSVSTRITENSSSIQQVSSSQQQISSSLLQVSASYISLSGSYNTFSGSASTRVTQIEQVYATTGSNSFRATQSITGSLVVSSTITAQTLVVQTVTSSIVYSSGSNIFGNALNNTQTFTGSVLITGSLTIAGGSSATSYSGATIYGSTAVCSPVGKFTTCIDAGSGNFSSTINAATGITIGTSGTNDISWNTSGGIKLGRTNVGPEYALSQAWTGVCAYIDIGSSCQWNGGVRILPNGGGNVGLNCTDPKYTLDVNGLVNINAQATGCQGTVQSLRISSNIADAAVTINACSLLNYAYLAFAQNCVGKFEIGFSSCTDTTSPSTFYLNPNVQKGACGSAVVIKSNGNVGIGTTSPTQLLSLSSACTLGTAVNIINTSTGGYNWNIFSEGSDATKGPVGSLIFRDSTNGVSRMTISSAGNVGIGTATIPSDHILQIHSTCSYGRMALTNTSTGVASGDGLIFQMENCLAIIKNQETSCLVLGTNGRETDIVIDTNGGVGIGQSPINKFTILAGNSNVLDLFDTGAGFGIGMQAMNSAATVYRSWDFYASKYQFFSGQSIFSCQICALSGVKFGNGSGTLNYYEQGTWTPRLKNGSFTTNAGVGNAGWYTRIGNLVTVGGTLDWGAGSGAQDGNSLQIACLPFASSNTSNERNVGQPGAPAASSIGFKCTGKGQLVLVNDPGASYIYLIETFQDGSYTTYIHNPLVANAGTIYGFQITYHTL